MAPAWPTAPSGQHCQVDDQFESPWSTVAGQLAIKQSDGFTRLWWSVVWVVAAVAGFVILAMVVRHLPVGTAYAVWAGIGAVGVTIAGVVVFSAMIVVGLVGCDSLSREPVRHGVGISLTT
ncbi:DMT family transporter [Mycolicibacterium fortuitum]|uniref:DMT family transporter n=1 Tax=Mycolicibacterium fortuitum TaxID=1766 RepID=UPI000AED2366|nr:SMR family transporter [Mycolicibacterium fortuitum]